MWTFSSVRVMWLSEYCATLQVGIAESDRSQTDKDAEHTEKKGKLKKKKSTTKL